MFLSVCVCVQSALATHLDNGGLTTITIGARRYTSTGTSSLIQSQSSVWYCTRACAQCACELDFHVWGMIIVGCVVVVAVVVALTCGKGHAAKQPDIEMQSAGRVHVKPKPKPEPELEVLTREHPWLPPVARTPASATVLPKAAVAYQQVPPPAQPVQAVAVAVFAAPGAFCGSCGKANTSGGNFCAGCGGKMT